jgi:hypothetical protein
VNIQVLCRRKQSICCLEVLVLAKLRDGQVLVHIDGDVGVERGEESLHIARMLSVQLGMVPVWIKIRRKRALEVYLIVGAVSGQDQKLNLFQDAGSPLGIGIEEAKQGLAGFISRRFIAMNTALDPHADFGAAADGAGTAISEVNVRDRAIFLGSEFGCMVLHVVVAVRQVFQKRLCDAVRSMNQQLGVEMTNP